MADRIAVFAKGRPEQVGTPEDIYDRPVNRFVADFIGDINLLDAVKGPGDSVIVEGTPFAVSQDLSAYAQGDKVCAAVRPERIELAAPGDGLGGVVVSSTYMGADVRCEVRLADSTTLMVRVSPPFDMDLLRAGSAVSVRVRPDHMRVVA